MRWVLALALLCSTIGCRRSEPRPEIAPAAIATPAEPTPAEAVPPAQAAPVADAAPASASAAAPGPTPTASGEADAPTSPSAADTTSAPAKEEEHDDRIYSWVDAQGAVHYGSVDDVPTVRRSSARVVDSRVTVVSAEPLEAPRPAATPTPTPPEPEDNLPPGRRPPGPEPELDEQGLPIPGTMEDTAATRAARAAGQKHLDPAAVERRRQQELRDMKCKQKDGVWICG